MAGRMAAITLVLLVSAAPAAGAAGTALGAPGSVANWTEGDKDGTPSARNLEFVVTDGRTFTESEREDARHRVRLVDRRSLSYRQVNTARSGRWRITKTYVTDPARAIVLADVKFESLTGRPLVACRYAKECR
jgi:glucoamylase